MSPRLALRARSRTSDLGGQSCPRGLTLIELLIVIIILTTLVSAAIPILAPTNDDRRLREASRSVNAFIAAAQMKAIQLQRPFGVALKRLSKDTSTKVTPGNDKHDDNAVCIELYYVEQPAPYHGYDRTSAVRVARHLSRNGLVFLQFVVRSATSTGNDLPTGWDADLFPPNLIRPGDVIEVDGTRYELLEPLSSSPNIVQQSLSMAGGFYQARNNVDAVTIEAQPINDTGQMLNVEFDRLGRRIRDIGPNPSPAPAAPFWTNPSPYKILRQPKPTSAEPLQMPEGTAIDLRASGVGRDEYFYVPDVRDNSDDILIMFAPEGRVSRVTFSAMPLDSLEPDLKLFDETVTDNLFLLVGRRANAPPPGVGADPTLKSSVLSGKTEQQIKDMKKAVNWLLSESRWIVIGSQSGRVVTVENAYVSPQAVIAKYSATPSPGYLESTENMRNGQILDSREFARQMVQVGGR